MKKAGLRIIVALVIVLIAVLGSASAVSAEPPPAGSVDVSISGHDSQYIYYYVSWDNAPCWGYRIYMIHNDSLLWSDYYQLDERTASKNLGPMGVAYSESGTYQLVVRLVKKNGAIMERGRTPKYEDSDTTTIT